MTLKQRTLAGLKAIPREKLRTKIQRTAMGAFLIVLGIVSTWQFGAPWYVAVGGGLLGATVWSSELVVSALKLLGGTVIDLFRQKNAAERPPEGSS